MVTELPAERTRPGPPRFYFNFSDLQCVLVKLIYTTLPARGSVVGRKVPGAVERVVCADVGLPPPCYPRVRKGFRAFPRPVTRPTRDVVGPDQLPGFSQFAARILLPGLFCLRGVFSSWVLLLYLFYGAGDDVTGGVPFMGLVGLYCGDRSVIYVGRSLIVSAGILGAFMTIYRCSKFSTTTRGLNCARSAISSRVGRLRDRLGAILFSHFCREVDLASSNVAILRRTERVLRSRRGVLRSLHAPRAVRNGVHLTVSDSIYGQFFGSSFLRFEGRFPGVRLIIIRDNARRVFSVLHGGRISLVFALSDRVCSSRFVVYTRRRRGIRFFTSISGPLLGGRGVSLGRLYARSFMLARDGVDCEGLLGGRLTTRSLRVRPILRVKGPLRVYSLVGGDGVVSFLPSFVARSCCGPKRVGRLPIGSYSISI